VSVEAISWALNLAPVLADRGGQPSTACKFVLVGLANHAGPDGTAAFPSVAMLVRYTGLSERTVRTCLDVTEHNRWPLWITPVGHAGRVWPGRRSVVSDRGLRDAAILGALLGYLVRMGTLSGQAER